MKKISFLVKNFLFNFKPKKNLDKFNPHIKDLDLLFNYFGSDKGSIVKNPYNKNSNENLGHGFSKFYEKHLGEHKEKKLCILEIGAWKGASVAAFFFYFKNAKIFCIDKNFKFRFKSSRINYFNCDTTQHEDLMNFINFLKDKKIDYFDVIVDDGSHILSDMTKNLIFFFKLLKPGGYYIIEDYNHPSYFKYLNDLSKEEPLMDEILRSLDNKKNFNSNLFNHVEQKNVFEKISSVNTYKGKIYHEKSNISDIAFIKKSN